MIVFRLLGDMSHLASIFILIHRIFAMRSCRGLSLKTQAVYLLVFVTRYLNLFTLWVSLYNTLMKAFFITSSCFIIYLMVENFRPMDEEESTDTFKVQYIIVPCFILAFFFNYRLDVMEVLWSFSIFLEAVAFLPQSHMLKTTGQAEALTRYYVLAFGSYRAFYILHWIFRYVSDYVFDPIATIGGVIQMCINSYFIYAYWRKYPGHIDLESPPEETITEKPPMVVVSVLKGQLPTKASPTPEENVLDVEEELSPPPYDNESIGCRSPKTV